MENNTLIIVDCQLDFILEEAPLQVNGAFRAVENIINLIDSGVINNVIFTVNFHPYNHCSFREYGGTWSKHCVQHTYGATIYNELYKKCIEKNLNIQILRKGELIHCEEYGAVSKITDKRTFYELESLTDKVHVGKRDNIIICGLTGDCCVLETLKQLKPLYPSVYLEGIASIDNGEKLNTYINNNNCKIYVKC